jgi:ankyrin repeat protein
MTHKSFFHFAITLFSISSLAYGMNNTNRRLRSAVIENNITQVKELLDNEEIINVNYKDLVTNSLLINTTDSDPAILQLLLDKGADINATDTSGWTALHYACWKKNRHAVAELLIRNKANVNLTNSDGFSALYCACHAGNIKAAELLLDNNADINLPSKFGFTPLTATSSTNHLLLTKLLLHYNANIDHKDNFNQTARSIAVEGGCTGIVEAIDSEELRRKLEPINSLACQRLVTYFKQQPLPESLLMYKRM